MGSRPGGRFGLRAQACPGTRDYAGARAGVDAPRRANAGYGARGCRARHAIDQEGCNEPYRAHGRTQHERRGVHRRHHFSTAARPGDCRGSLFAGLQESPGHRSLHGQFEYRARGSPLMARELLKIANLDAWYGESHILHRVEVTVQEGEVVTLLGRNGAGRTTTLRAIMGLTGARAGSIVIGGVETVSFAPHRIARIGVGYCPEERGIFSTLSVEENLMLPPRLNGGGGMQVEEIYCMFPNLRERAASPGT